MVRIQSKAMFFTWGDLTADAKVGVERVIRGVFGRKEGYQFYIAH